MPFTEEEVLQVVNPPSAGLRGRRFTQDTPVLPDVWILFGTKPNQFHSLILAPHKHSSVEELFRVVRERTVRETKLKRGKGKEYKLSYNESHVTFTTDYEGLIRIVLPISSWWRKQIKLESPGQLVSALSALENRKDLQALLTDASTIDKKELPLLTQPLMDMIRIVGCIGYAQSNNPPAELMERGMIRLGVLKSAISYLRDVLKDIQLHEPRSPAEPPLLWNLFSDRQVYGAIHNSRLAVKADAARELFGIDCSGICWAVIDSGIDARHPAFRAAGATMPTTGSFAQATRVEKTLDFARLAGLTSISIIGGQSKPPALKGLSPRQKELVSRDLTPRLMNGQPLDWALLEDLLDVPHEFGTNRYQPPVIEHGTHVAGILAANWPDREGGPLIGMCPDLRLYDLRITTAVETAQESVLLAAMQYVRYKNANKGRMVVHGVNLSVSLLHNVKSFACGRTPVCEEANRMVAAGIVVVAAAGNSGMGQSGVGAATDYRAISITDPGNAEDVITVGATHNSMPHRYGVSYFSSRGPTGDGRAKPDLVAPGEQILSTVPDGGAEILDGTSMAAPHVSGAAALLMARHMELRGEPRRIKEILCKTATDLGRERMFQGAGMLDILRALQSV